MTATGQVFPLRTLVILLLAVSMLAIPEPTEATAADACRGAPASPFVDVKRRAWYAKDVDCAHWYRATRGVGLDEFRPGRSVRRAETAVTIFRVLKATDRGLPPPAWAFEDLDGHPHRRKFERLAAADIVDVPRDREFHPRWRVKRGKAAVYVLRAYRYATDTTRERAPDAFADDDGHRFERAINEAYALGLVTGHGATSFAPDDRITRAEFASFTRRLIERLAEEGELHQRTRRYEVRVRKLPRATRALMRGSSWRSGCPVPLRDLRALELIHRGMHGGRRWGVLVVHEDVAKDITGAFRDIYQAAFPVRRMRLVDRYGADDDRSMSADNTSGFNCRTIAGSNQWSMHAYGLAVDINPVENPYVDGSTVEPEAGRDYLDRSDVRPGMVVRPGPVVEAFGAIGWGWGGDWRAAEDYQHLSITGG